MGDRGQVANPGVISGKQYDTKEIKSNMKHDKQVKEKVYAFTSIKSNCITSVVYSALCYSCQELNNV